MEPKVYMYTEKEIRIIRIKMLMAVVSIWRCNSLFPSLFSVTNTYDLEEINCVKVKYPISNQFRKWFINLTHVFCHYFEIIDPIDFQSYFT